MRAALIMGALVGLWAAIPAAAQQETVREGFYGCVSQHLTDEYTELVKSGDATASSMFFLNQALAGKCRAFEKGERVFIRDIDKGFWSFPSWCYRPAGSTACFFRARI